MNYQFASHRSNDCGFECTSTSLNLQGPPGPPGPPGKGNCSINAYGGVFNNSGTATVGIAGEQVIQTLGHMPNLNTSYNGTGIKIEVEGDYEINMHVTTADAALGVSVYARRNGVPIPESADSRLAALDFSTTYYSDVIVHLNCGDVIDIGISGLADATYIKQYGAALTVKKLDTQVCCECLEKLKREHGCCAHCPKASHEIKNCKDSC